MSSTAQAMESERAEKVAAERSKIEKADKVKLAKANKEAKANKAAVAAAAADRKAKDAAKPAAKPAAKKKTSPPMTDAEVASFVKKFAAPGMTKSGVVKAFRAAGHSAACHRIRDAFDEVTKGRSKTKKK